MRAVPSIDQQLHGVTLVLPVVAVGNVAQLAADLLLNTLQAHLMARINDPAVLPAVGHHALDHDPALATAMELYHIEDAGGGCIAVLQQRSAAAPGTQEGFAQRLAALAKQSGAKEVLVLGSMDASFRRDPQLAGTQLRCWAPTAAEDPAAGADHSSGLLQRCSGVAPVLEASFLADCPAEQRLLPPWPLLRFLQQAGVPCASLLSFSSEGDNTGDGLRLATAAASVLGLRAQGSTAAGAEQQLHWVPPSSWQTVYGSTKVMY